MLKKDKIRENPKKIKYLIQTKIYRPNELEKIMFTKNLAEKLDEFDISKGWHLRNYKYNIIKNLINIYF